MASRAASTPRLVTRLVHLARPWAARAPQPPPFTRPFATAPRLRLDASPCLWRPRRPSVRLRPEDEAEAIVSGETPVSESARPDLPQRDPRQAAYYQLSFTCVPCGHRSHHNISKQGYHHGSILITCPGCRDRHVISDHLQIFGDRKITVEDLMRERGRLVKRGSLGEDGDVEFWPDEPEQSTDEPPKRLAGDSAVARDS